jgi:hypothetical protein
MVVVIASMLMVIVPGGVLNNSSILLPMANAQKPHHAEFGVFASIQNGKDGKPAWITHGVWDYDHIYRNRSNKDASNCQALCPSCRALIHSFNESIRLRWKHINNGVSKCFIKYPDHTLEITRSPNESQSILEVHLSEEYIFDPLKGLITQYNKARKYASLAAQRLRFVIADKGQGSNIV